MSSLCIEAIRLLCRDTAATARFYVDAFGCEEIERDRHVCALRLGAQRLELGRASAPSGHPPLSNETGFQHFAIPVSDMEAAMARLERMEGWIPISTDGPERLPAASGGVTAFKFRDPEGHPLEFLEFPGGWEQRPAIAKTSEPFLGIDHSAITVSDVDASIRFYESLGYRLKARQRNRGAEQGRLDGFSRPATVDVVTLETGQGGAPHLELLAYVDPPAISAPAVEGSPFATELILSGLTFASALQADPDGHRFSNL
ncbi:VOC family protein [Aureimonas ureilytica]|uniref:VOC family protein n=1 Tax=Aureimonas ureilytica TaxID=401562 RepID=UPI0007344A83|nr:VOC family protein [Aureimonas ureilytica]